MASSADDRVRPYLGRVLTTDGKPVGTCFQAAPGVLVTAWHVVERMGSGAVDGVVWVDSLAGGGPSVDARVVRTDPRHDLAVLIRTEPLMGSVTGFSPTDETDTLTPVTISGVSEVGDLEYRYEWLDATGTWQGGTTRDAQDGTIEDEQVKLGRLTSIDVMPGMSGAPVRRLLDDVVVGIVSARYNSADGWLRDSVWVARTEHLRDLLDGITAPLSWRPAIRATTTRTAGQPARSGEAFREQVQRALTIAGYTVRLGPLIDNKKVPVLATTHRWQREWRVAVECRTEDRPLSKSQLTRLWAEYEPLYQTGQVHELLVVSSGPAASGAVAWAESRPGISLQSLASLLASTLDLTSYLRSAATTFEESPDGLAKYYVPPHTRDGDPLEGLVLRWLDDSPDSIFPVERPLAILGSYGIGKSSFAIRLTSMLAERTLTNPTARVPVLIRLGEIAAEQNLEGLLGTHFTATNAVPGYSFSTFLELNKGGRFVTILDGFDEMKQLLSWTEFKYNLAQLNRLAVGNAKVILLGRPTAFENDEEQEHALHGKHVGPLGPMRAPGTVDYHEVELSPLDLDQVRNFLIKYLTYRDHVGRQTYDLDLIWRQVRSKHLRDIAHRPVQLRMLADILPHYTGAIEELDLVTLYDTFIDQLIDEVMLREEEKPSRLAFDGKVRRDFLQRLALWMWTERGGGIITSDRIPDELVAPFVPAGRDPRSVRRDLVVASPLDRRYGERLRFAHRSFQEFLVAKEAWRRFEAGEMTVAEYDDAATDEVATFSKLLRKPRHADLIANLIRTVTGSVTWRTADSLLLEPSVVTRLQAQLHDRQSARMSRLSPWQLLVAILPSIEGNLDSQVEPAALAAQATSFDDGSGDLALSCLFLLAATHPKSIGGTTRASSTSINDVLLFLLKGNRGVREE
ncbi:trypsin-like peptidase domain-containing protein, partial [Micromonospora sp. H61]|uniref:serine protease n=1 Tax=Micromonospora sp. H61 TaxID=2824888 RepID=UPI001B380724